jgi:hypothetical protein
MVRKSKKREKIKKYKKKTIRKKRKRRKRNKRKLQKGGSIASSFFRFLADAYEKENIEDKQRKEELKIKLIQEKKERNVKRETVDQEIYDREKRENEEELKKQLEDEDLRIIDTNNEEIQKLEGGGPTEAILLASLIGAKLGLKKGRKKRIKKRIKKKKSKKVN